MFKKNFKPCYSNTNEGDSKSKLHKTLTTILLATTIISTLIAIAEQISSIRKRRRNEMQEVDYTTLGSEVSQELHDEDDTGGYDDDVNDLRQLV